MSHFKAPPVALFQPGLVWFNQADKNAIPCPAIPIEQSGNGVLTLLVMRKQNSTVLTKLGVRHVDDPFLQGCMDARLDCGGWDVAPGSLRAEIDALRAQIEELVTSPEPKRGKKELANA